VEREGFVFADVRPAGEAHERHEGD
jgi:hypothetical protein